MNRLIFTALALLLASCQTLPSAKPAVCDGRHLRPANPLPAAAPQAAPDPKSLKPCGGAP